MANRARSPIPLRHPGYFVETYGETIPSVHGVQMTYTCLLSDTAPGWPGSRAGPAGEPFVSDTSIAQPDEPRGPQEVRHRDDHQDVVGQCYRGLTHGHALGEFRRIHDLLCDAAILAEALNDQRRLGLIADRLCLVSWQIGNYRAALESGQRALAISVALGDVNRQLSANVDLAQTYIALGEYRRAIASLMTAVSLEGVLRPLPCSPTGTNDVNARARLSQCLA
jgi:hypothetical protein